MDILKGGAINKQDFYYRWFYKENDNNAYLMEIGVRSPRITIIYKINIDNFEISKIFQANTSYFDFFIEGNNLYLMKFVEPSNGKDNYELNFIVLHNLLSKDETIIKFNELLPKDKQVRAPSFFVGENKILFLGYQEIINRKLHIYNIIENTIKIIDEYVWFGYYGFSVSNDIILYYKEDVEEIPDGVRIKGGNFYVYNLINNTYKILPYQATSFDFLVIDENTIIYTDIYFKKRFLYYHKYYISPDKKPYTNYYIADINTNKSKLFFSTHDEINILGVKNK